MAEVNFEIQGKQGEIAASTFRKAVAEAVSLLQEFDSAISEKPQGSLRWYIGRLNSNGNLLINFRSRLRPQKHKDRSRLSDVSPNVTMLFIEGLDDIENKCKAPASLSEYGLQKAEKLTALIGKNGATGFRFSTENREVELTSKSSENIGKLLPIRRKAIGSVEGKLEAINLHNKSRVIVYHAITKRPVACEFQLEKVMMDRVKDYLGKRVTVFGTLHKNVNGDTLRVSMERLALVGEGVRVELEKEKGNFSEPEFADAKSTAEYIRRIRSGR